MISCAPCREVINPSLADATGHAFCKENPLIESIIESIPASSQILPTSASILSASCARDSSKNLSSLSCYAIDGVTTIKFSFDLATNRLSSVCYLKSNHSPDKPVTAYPCIQLGEASICPFSKITKDKLDLFILGGKWEVTPEGELRFWGIRGCGGANPKQDKMDLEIGMLKTEFASNTQNSGKPQVQALKKQDSRWSSLIVNPETVRTKKGAKGTISSNQSPIGGVSIELIHKKHPSSSNTSKQQEAQLSVSSSAPPASVSQSKAQTGKASSASSSSPASVSKRKTENVVQRIHQASHEVTKHIAKREESLYKQCVNGMKSLYNYFFNHPEHTPEQKEHVGIICGFGKWMILATSVVGLIGSLLLREVENGNLNLSEALGNYTGNFSLLDDEQWSHFLEDLKGLRDQKVNGSITYYKGPMSITYTPPLAYYQFLQSLEPINKELSFARSIGEDVKKSLSSLDPCNTYALPQELSKSEQEAYSALLVRFKQQCARQGHINYDDFFYQYKRRHNCTARR